MKTCSKTLRPRFNRLAIAAGCAALFALDETSSAATINRTNTATLLNVAGSWTGGVVPGVGDIAQWNNTVSTAANTNIALGANMSWQGISVATPAADVTIPSTGGFNITLGSAGIAVSATRNLSIAAPIVLGSAQSWNVGNATTRTATISGIVSGNGFLLTKSGIGTLTLSAANTFDGGFTLAAGTVNANSNGSLGTGALTINGGTIARSTTGTSTLTTTTQTWGGDFSLGGQGSINFGTGAVSMGASRTLTISGSGTYTQGGILSGPTGTSLTTTNAAGGNTLTGILVLSGANTYDGGTNINGGLLRFNSGAIPATGNITIGINGALSVSGANTTLASWLGDTRLQSSSAGALSLAGDSSENFNPGASSFNSISLGADLGATAIYTGTITPVGSTYRVGGGGGTINFANSSAFAAGNDMLIGNGGGGTVIVAENNAAFNGAVTINTGTLQLGTGLAVGSLGTPSSITNNGAIVFNRSDNISLANAISGSGSVTKTGTGTLTLTATQTYLGGTTVSGGTLALSGANDRLPTTTAFVLGSGTLDVGSTTQNLSNFALQNSTLSGAITGAGGTLSLSQALLHLGPTTTANPTNVNMSGLSNFIYNNSTGTFRVGPMTTSTGITSQVATVTLGTNNTITASNFFVADLNLTSNTGLSTLNLGQTNDLKVGTINVGFSGRSGGTLKFATGLTNPTVTIRGTAGGTSAATALDIGDVANNATTVWTSTVDFTAGTVDANITTMRVGSADNGTNTVRRGTQIGNYLMGKGTLNVDTLNIGIITGTTGTVNTGEAYGATGNVTLNDATGVINATTITMATNTIPTSTGGAKTVTGNLNLVDGTLRATTIQRGAQTGTATATTNLNWTTGTLSNIPGADLSISNVPINLLTAAAHNFNISGTNTANIDATAPINGTGSGITKQGTGNLVLNAVNTYTGSTTISSGTLALAGAGTLGTGNVIVNSILDISGITPANYALGTAQVLSGAGTINTALKTLNVDGTLSPGNSPGVLSVTGNVALSGTTMSNFEIAGLGSFDQLGVTGTLAYGGALNISTTQNSGLYDLFALSNVPTGNFTSVTLSGAGYSGSLTNTLGVWSGTDGFGTTATFTQATGDLLLVAAIPEPSTLVLGGLALLGFAGAGLRRRRLAKQEA